MKVSRVNVNYWWHRYHRNACKVLDFSKKLCAQHINSVVHYLLKCIAWLVAFFSKQSAGWSEIAWGSACKTSTLLILGLPGDTINKFGEPSLRYLEKTRCCTTAPRQINCLVTTTTFIMWHLHHTYLDSSHLIDLKPFPTYQESSTSFQLENRNEF